MSRRDHYHNCVVAVLLAAGWIIEDDPFVQPFANSFVRMDLSISRTREDGLKEFVAVEIKNFKEQNKYLNEFEKGLGQYLVYQNVLDAECLPHKLFLAIPEPAYKEFFSIVAVEKLLVQYQLSLIVFDPDTSTITLWKPHVDTGI